jgi:hypothetical protein
MPRLCPAALLLTLLLVPACAALATGGDAGVQIASSALLVVDASVHKHDIVLHITRTANHAPIEGAGNVTVDINGHPLPIATSGASYVLSTQGLKGGPHTLQVIVAHDGIHELLTGTVTLPKPPDRLATLETHGYAAWWVLNIVVLLLAARLIMRRKKPPPPSP